MTTNELRAMPFRPALAPLRGSARFAVFGLAAVAIAGCSIPPPEECLTQDGARLVYAPVSGSTSAAPEWAYFDSAGYRLNYTPEKIRCRLMDEREFAQFKAMVEARQ